MWSDIRPRDIACRVDIDRTIWVLVEYNGANDEWQRFKNEVELNDFVHSFPGAPLQVPQKRLSVEESMFMVSCSSFAAATLISNRNQNAKRKLSE